VLRIFSIVCLLFASSVAISAEYQEGVHYQRLAQPQPTDTKNKVEVREMFWYGCPHCYRLEPYVERWLRRKPEQAEFIRTPAAMVPHWQTHARAFYTAEVLGVLEQIHRPLFDAIHVQGKKLNNIETLADFFAGFGVEKAKFFKTYRSFAVETRFRRAKTLASRYNLSGVPAMIVNGKYLVTNRMTGGNAQTMKVINFLVKLESSS